METIETSTSAQSGTKRAILDIAGDLFAQHGYDGTSIRDIASALGTSKAALYYHFENKDAILLALALPALSLGDQWLLPTGTTGRTAETARLALGNYYALLGNEAKLFDLLVSDPAVRNHEVVGRRLHDQAKQFYDFLNGPNPTFESRIRASAAVGAIRQAVKLTPNHEEAALDLAVSILDL
jgi:AcrR family transcriptional regulator